MSQRNVEIFIGKLATDRDLRVAFGESPKETLDTYRAEGHDLGTVEAAALAEIDVQSAERFASTLDPRICKLSPTENRRSK